MPVKVTRDFKAVKTGEVYPSTIAAGTVVEGRLEEIARDLGFFEPITARPVLVPAAVASSSASGADTAPDSAGASGADPAPAREASPADPPRVIRAKLTESYEGPDKDGKPVKIRKGAYVRNADAEYFVTLGAAEAIDFA